MEGEFFENCSCDAICPCTWSNMARPATYDDCRFALAFQVERGDIEGTDVSGRTFVLVAQTPRMMPEGNWKLGIIVDDGASEDQVGALGRVLGGELGGPPAAVAPFLGEFLGLEQLPITITNDGRRHHVQAGNAIDYSGERMLDPGRRPGLAHQHRRAPRRADPRPRSRGPRRQQRLRYQLER